MTYVVGCNLLQQRKRTWRDEAFVRMGVHQFFGHTPILMAGLKLLVRVLYCKRVRLRYLSSPELCGVDFEIRVRDYSCAAEQFSA